MRNLPAKLPKIIIIVLALGVLVELGLSIKTLLAPIPMEIALKPAPISAGTLSLVTQRNRYKVGEFIPVFVWANTGGHRVDGIDALIKFDNKLLDASSSAIVLGTAFPEYPQVTVDQKSGSIRISGITGTSGTSFSGVDKLAVIYFKAVSHGTATATLDFTKPGDTADSNMINVGSPDDILGKVVDLKVTITK